MNQRGLSLLELMVALALGLIVVLGVTRVFLGSQQGYRLQESTGRLQENARFAMDVLSREIRHADFWAGTQPNLIRKHASLATVGPPCTESWFGDVARPIQAWAGGATSPLGGCTVANYVPGSDVIVVRYADPTEYLRTSELAGTGITNGRLFLRSRVGRDGYLFPHDHRGDAVSTIFPGDERNGVLTHRLGGRVLFLRTNAQGRPALYMRRPDGSASGVSNSTELVEGVEMLRYQFGVDETGNGVVDRFINTGAMTAADWPRVLVVRAAFIVRGDALDDFLDDATYTLPDGFQYTPQGADRRFLRRLFVQDIQLRNRLGRS